MAGGQLLAICLLIPRISMLLLICLYQPKVDSGYDLLCITFVSM